MFADFDTNKRYFMTLILTLAVYLFYLVYFCFRGDKGCKNHLSEKSIRNIIVYVNESEGILCLTG